MNTKFLLASVLAFTSLSSFSATSANLNLKGSIGAISEISLVADSAAQTINVSSGETNLKVATVSEVCNHKDGFDVNVSSQNGGYLVNSANSAMKTDYTISYHQIDKGQPTTAPMLVKTVDSLSGLTTLYSDVKVSVTAAPNASAGDYTDVLTFSIVAK